MCNIYTDAYNIAYFHLQKMGIGIRYSVDNELKVPDDYIEMERLIRQYYLGEAPKQELHNLLQRLNLIQ